VATRRSDLHLFSNIARKYLPVIRVQFFQKEFLINGAANCINRFAA